MIPQMARVLFYLIKFYKVGGGGLGGGAGEINSKLNYKISDCVTKEGGPVVSIEWPNMTSSNCVLIRTLIDSEMMFTSDKISYTKSVLLFVNQMERER